MKGEGSWKVRRGIGKKLHPPLVSSPIGRMEEDFH
jgi:hypothetical protein